MRVRGLMLDLDGTLYDKSEPIPGAREALQRFKASGIALRYVTNTTRKPRRAVFERLQEMGFEVGEGEILTPAGAAAGLIGGKTCFSLVDESLLEDLPNVTFTDEQPDFVLVGEIGEGFTYARLNQAFRRLLDGAELVALQKNRYWQTEGGLSLDAGPFVAALEYATGRQATVVGKPEERFFRSALEDMGLEASEVAMVGDDAETDVAGAKRVGLKAVQVKTGKWRPGDESPGADLVLDNVAGLPEALDLSEGEG